MQPTRHLLLATLALPQSALAGGYSVDPELLVPSFGSGDLPGLDGAEIPGRGSARAGVLYQYISDPVVLFEDRFYIGTPVSRRATVFSGVSVDLSPSFTLRAVLPAASQVGDDDTGLSANGYGLGDARLGARWLLPLDGALEIGVNGELFLPVGTQYAWLGEDMPRATLGLVSRLSLGPVDLLADTSATHRTTVETGLDLTMAPELRVNAGLRLGSDRVGVYAVGLTRLMVDRSSSLAGRTAIEAIGGLQLRPWGPLALDLGFGNGLTSGLGSSEWRALASLRVERRAAMEAYQRHTIRDPLARVEELEEAPVRVVALEEAREPPPEPVWEDGELARVRVETATIEIREPIQFEFGTERVLPISIPTLEAVAAILEANPEIEALVIEGHASEEGSYLYNYDLAYRRSGAVFRELVLAGVHPYRLSTRSMGEVVPLGASVDEESLAANRRVEFHITRQRHPLEPAEPLDASIHQPWDGAPRGASAPAEDSTP